MTLDDIEVRTGSVPAAAHLLLAGFEPLGIVMNARGTVVRFSAAARGELERFHAAKGKIDQLLDTDSTAFVSRDGHDRDSAEVRN